MKERFAAEQDLRQQVLGTIDGIVDGNPKIRGLLPNNMNFTFSVGYCPRAGEAQAPRQVVIMNVPPAEQNGQIATVAVQAANRGEDFRLWNVEPAQAVNIVTGTPLEDEQLIGLQGLLTDTEFGNEELVKAFGAQYEQFMTDSGPEARWLHGMLLEPVADLSQHQSQQLLP